MGILGACSSSSGNRTGPACRASASLALFTFFILISNIAIISAATGDIFVGTFASNRVLKLNSTGGVLWNVSLPNNVYSVASIPDGGVAVGAVNYGYYLMPNGSTLMSLNTASVISYCGSQVTCIVASIAISLFDLSSVGSTYTTGSYAGLGGMGKYSINGSMVWTNTPTGMYTASVNPTDGSAVGGTGTHDMIYKYDSAGGSLWSVTLPYNVYSLAVNQMDGSIAVGTCAAGACASSNVLKLNSSGGTVWNVSIAPLGSYSVAVNPIDGSIIVGTYTGNRVLKLNSTGGTVWNVSIGYRANSVAVNPIDGSIIVGTDTDNRVLKLDSTGGVVWNVLISYPANSVAVVTPALVSACGNISLSSLNYTTAMSVLFVRNFSSNGTCFNVTANRNVSVTLDCQGYSLNGNGTGYGAYFNMVSNSVVKNCIIRNFNYGAYASNSNNNTIYSNTFYNNTYDVYFYNSTYNNMYNNLFNNTNNVVFDGANTWPNYWNTTKQPGTNIINGPYLGGNVWANPSGTGFSQTCADTDADGICNSPSYYQVGPQNNIDNLPLAVYGGAPLAACGNISYAGSYILTQNVSSSGTCFSITANNVALNCQGFTIRGSTTGYGINISGRTSTAVRNCVIANYSSGINLISSNGSTITNNMISNSTYGIYASNSSNNALYNNTVLNSTYGGYVDTTSNNNSLMNNRITSTINGNAISVSGASNSLTNNNITSTSNNPAVSVSGAYNSLTNNSITSTIGFGISLTSSNNSIINNNITSYLTGINVGGTMVTSNNNSIISNSITTNGSGANGIILLGMPPLGVTNYNNITSNNITTNGSSSHGISLSSSLNNTLTSNRITTSSSSAYGAYLSSSSNNTLASNNIATNGTTAHGAYLYSSSNNNTIANNTIATNGSMAHGIFLDSSNSSTLTSNTIATNGSGAHGAYLYYSSNNTLTNNTIATNITNALGAFLYYSSNNTVTNNKITSKQSNAAYLTGSSNNRLYNNLLNGSSSPVYVDTSINFWNTTKTAGTNIVNGSWIGGNVYANSSGNAFSQTCVDTSPADGICDSAYTLNTSNIDYLPLKLVSGPADTTPPVINTISDSPDPVTQGANITITANITDNIAVSSARVQISSTNYTMAQSGSIWTYSYNTSSLSSGLYNYTVYANDTSNNNATPKTGNFTVVVSQFGCGDLNSANTIYNMTQNLNSTGTCFNVRANNITLDCKGFTINYSTSSRGYAVNITGYNNATIKNCKIVQGGASGSAYAIYLSSARYSNITNNTITTSGSTAFGAYLASSSNYNTLTNNTITTKGPAAYGAYLYSSSNNNILTSNKITTNGIDASGAYLESSSNNNLTNNKITSLQSNAAYLTGSSNNRLYNNLLNGSYYSSYYYSPVWVDTTGNVWNTTRAAGTNIVNGSWIGGNFYATSDGDFGFSQTCGDISPADGICDSQYDIMGDGSNIDYLPLTWPTPADPTPPTTTATAKNADNSAYTFGTFTKQSVTVTLSCADNTGGSGCSVTRYCTTIGLSCVPGTTYSTPYTISAEGNTTTCFRSVDVAGNSETAQCKQVNIDKTPPVSTMATAPSAPNGEHGWFTSDVGVSITAADSLSGIGKTYVCADQDNSCTPAEGASATVSSEGANYVRYYSIDKAGNAESLNVSQINLDKSDPSASLQPLLQYDGDGIVNLQWSSSDSISGVSQVEVYRNSQLISTSVNDAGSYDDDLSAPANDGQEFSYTVKAKDFAGHTMDSSLQSTVIDLSPPSVPSIVPLPAFTAALNVAVQWFRAVDTISGVGLYDIYNNMALLTTLNEPDPMGTDTSVQRSYTDTVSDGQALSYQVSAVDRAVPSHESDKSDSASTTVDVTAPATTINIDPDAPNGLNGWYVTPAGIVLNCTDAVSGCAYTNYSLDGAEYATYTGPMLVETDGEHSISAFSVDNAGNIGQTESRTFRIDRTAPVISNDPAPALTNDLSLVVSGTVADNIGVGSFTINGAQVSFGSDGSYSETLVLSEGLNAIDEIAVDTAGNNATHTKFVTLDIINPATAAAYEGAVGENGWYVSDVTVTLTASDSGSGVSGTYVCVDESDSCIPAAGTTATIDAEGIHYVRYYSIDNADNFEDIHSDTVNVDTKPPVISNDPVPELTKKADLIISGKATDSMSGVSLFTVDGERVPLLEDGSYLTTVALSEGQNEIAEAATDAAGHTATATKAVTLDTIFPVTTAAYEGTPGTNGWYTSDVSVTLSASDSDGGSGVNATYVCVDQDNTCVPAEGSSAAITTEGTNYVRYYSIDIAGNDEQVHSDIIMIDKSAPVIAIDSLPEFDSDGSYVVSWNASDNIAMTLTFNVYRDGELYATTANDSISESGIPDGVRHSYYVEAVDWAGLSTASDSVSTTVDLSAPTAPWLNPLPVYTTALSVSLGWNASEDILSGVRYYTVYKDGETLTTTPYYTMAYTDSAAIEGMTYGYAVSATDFMFHESDKSDEARTTIDTLPPETSYAIAGISGDNGWYKQSSVGFSLAANDTTSGVAAIRYRLNGGAWTNYTGTFQLDDGVWNVDYYSVDTAGNSEQPKSVLVNVDTKPPVTIDNAPSVWMQSDFTVQLNASDEGSSVAAVYSCVDTTNMCVPSAGPTSFPVAEAINYVRYYSIDIAGNAEAMHAKLVKLDKTPPVTKVVVNGTAEDEPFSDHYMDSANVTLTASNGLSHVYTVYYCIDRNDSCAPSIAAFQCADRNESVCPSSVDLSVPVTAKGTNYVRFSSVDVAGKVEAVNSVDVSIDKDSDSDTIYDNFDSCQTVAGRPAYLGCPVGESSEVMMDIIDAGKTGECGCRGTMRFKTIDFKYQSGCGPNKLIRYDRKGTNDTFECVDSGGFTTITVHSMAVSNGPLVTDRVRVNGRDISNLAYVGTDPQGRYVWSASVPQLKGKDRLKLVLEANRELASGCRKATSCEQIIDDAQIMVFNMSDPSFIAAWGKAPKDTKYPDIFEWGRSRGVRNYSAIFNSSIGLVTSCTTDETGTCIAGEPGVGNYLAIAKFQDDDTNKTAYVGRTKDPGDFKDTDRDRKPDFAEKDFIVTKVLLKDGKYNYVPSSKLQITGSLLTVTAPDYMLWEGNETVYPFLFTSDSEWTADACLFVPEGYDIVGDNCTSLLVANETKELLFTAVETGSPEPDTNFTLAATHQGVTKTISVDIPGQRLNPPFDWMTLLPIALFLAVAVVVVGVLATRMKKQ